MKTHRISLVLAMVLTLIVATETVFAAKTDGTMPPPPPRGMPTGICADEHNLYVVADGKVMQFQVTDLTLVATLNLPKPVAPEGTPPIIPPEESTSGQLQPRHPMGSAPQGVWASDGMLYILAGPTIYRYSIPDLILQTPVELPKPVPPTASN